ncbi:MAG TPA: hypothetical protein VGV93_04260 [Acidimicrobiales bacterium]|nr:hypothetical protein [Acidimicrobiales bacterium]
MSEGLGSLCQLQDDDTADYNDNEDEVEFGPPGTLGRARHVSEDGRQLAVDSRPPRACGPR